MVREGIERMIKESEEALGREHDELADSVRADLQKFKGKAMDRV
ncbi:hypothetical protein CENSYa_1443 [Cenarchaeum symbiosum A]|uniref:Uncharacterized protein n=1 Tax=Cenarchaeum symbiosum (strain A) TaxID=414004 RepID=A0RXJ8_CENSY|nr:hypothetical protein CENSYa_1443 [Cenarchaeum symbiosum A]